MPPDERRMTFIVVPHGGRDLSTRSFEISYRRLRVVGVLLLAGMVAWLAMVLSWVWVASQAARVPALKNEVRALEREQARVVQLAEALHRLEGQYEQVRQMLGADQSATAGEVYLPPIDSASRPPTNPAR
jgi:hypothetical protein